MTQDPLVSIVTPTYNHAQFIGECIQSVLRQTYTNWEQIVIDDGSSDRTVDVVNSLGDPRIRCISQVHLGIWRIAEIYNRALAEATGSLIAILEGDDYWLPAKLGLLVPVLLRSDAVMAFGRTRVLTGTSQTRVVPDGQLERAIGLGALENRPVGTGTQVLLKGRNFAIPCGVVIRRSALDDIGGFQSGDGLGVTDFPTFLALSEQGPFRYCPQDVAVWRRHPSAASWRFEETMAIGAMHYAVRYVQAHPRLSHLTSAEVHRAWQIRLSGIAFQVGRSLLIDGRWSEARKRFVDAALQGSLGVRVAALTAYVASLIHLDIEWLARLFGRLDLHALVSRDQRDPR